MFVWNLRDPPNAVPESGTRVWLYAVTADGSGNKRVELGGSLAINHDPFIFLESGLEPRMLISVCMLHLLTLI